MAQHAFLVDAVQRPIYLHSISTLWISQRVGWIGAVGVLGVAIWVVVARDTISASLAGLCFSYILLLGETASVSE